MNLETRDAPDRSRYELLDDGEVIGIADYRDDGERVVFPHTVIDADRRGHGLGEILVRYALDDVRSKGRSIVPVCWFVAEFVDLNPEYRDLVA
jgi:uncharacterized protein